jgi:hypothetical protein
MWMLNRCYQQSTCEQPHILVQGSAGDPAAILCKIAQWFAWVPPVTTVGAREMATASTAFFVAMALVCGIGFISKCKVHNTEGAAASKRRSRAWFNALRD